MRNIQTPTDRARQSGQVAITTIVPRVRETLTVSPKEPSTGPLETRTTFAGKRPEEWTADDVQAYVVSQIESRFGPFPKDPVRMASTFRAFCSRYGQNAGRIAAAAFEVYEGKWKGARIGWQRFCKASDQYFSQEILERLSPLA